MPPTRLLETRTNHTNTSSSSSSNGSGNDALNNYIVINSSDMNAAAQADGDDHVTKTWNSIRLEVCVGNFFFFFLKEFSPLNAPLFQLIRRLNNRRHGTSNNNNNESANPEGRRPPPATSSSLPIDWSSLINTEANPAAHGASSTATMPRGRTSLHYRLRRHGNPHMANSSTNPTRSELGSHSMGGSGSSRIPIYNRHRFVFKNDFLNALISINLVLRFQRSPASGFHFNFLDDDEILNDQGAIIITTVTIVLNWNKSFICA